MAQKFTTPIVIRNITSAASDALAVSVDGEAADRIKFEAGGRLVWGGGASAGDVNLYRHAADLLKTDDAFQADGGIITVTTDGAPTLSLPDGALAIDTTNNLLYIRTNGAWEIASGGGGASVTVADAAPVGGEEGDLWYESDTGKMFVYYDSYWIEVGAVGEGGAGYPGGTVRVTDQDTTADVLYDKVVAGENIELTVVNAGAVEQLRISAPSLAAYTIALGG